MDDRAIVAALVAGDQRGLDGVYRTYADRLYTYCRFLLHDSDGAADALHDTFVLASQRAAQLRDPDRLRPWLYAIARNECLRVLRGRRRQVPLEEAGQVPVPVSDPGAGLNTERVRELVWAAAAGLNDGDRQVFELAVRHDLSAVDVGAVLGVSADHAHARLSRSRAQMERAIGALLVARTGADDCAELGRLLRGWDGTLTVLLRKRISRHIESCSTCDDRRREQVRPAVLFSAYATLPMLLAPAQLRPRLELTCADAGLTARQIDRRAGRFDRVTGFPRPVDRRRRRSMVAGLATAAVLALLVGGGLIVPGLAAVDDTAGPAPAGPPGAATTVPAVPTHPPSVDATGPSPVDSSMPSMVPTPDVPTSVPTRDLPTGPPTPDVPLRVRAKATVTCDGSGRYTLRVAAAIADGTLGSATLSWWAGGSGTIGDLGTVAERGQTPLRVTTTTAAGQVPRLSVAQLTWRVAMTTVDGRRAATEPGTVTNPCPAPQ